MKKTVLLLGHDGYIGCALTQSLLEIGYDVVGVDNYSRRKNVENSNSISAITIHSENERYRLYNKIGNFVSYTFDVSSDIEKLAYLLKTNKIDYVVNLAHNPSAPYSMKNWNQSDEVLKNNICGTNNLLWCIREYCPETPFLTIGSTGEYNHSQNTKICEGYFQYELDGRKSVECLFPRKANSLYHASKIASTYMIDYLAKPWNLRCTDVMQAVVFGSYTNEIDFNGINTRLDSDESQGTVINRFVVQACINEPLTIYGEGKHQRGFISLNDSVQALLIAINNPAEPGIVQSWNQISEWHSINDVANMVCEIGSKLGLNVSKQYIPTPRPEHTGEHYYEYVCEKLKTLGYKPTRTIEQEIEYTMKKVLTNIEKNPSIVSILKNNVIPKIKF